jgi:uncharacterized protein (DUF4415 family)
MREFPRVPEFTLGMAHRSRKSPVAKPKSRYRVENWCEYNRALVALWIDEAVLAGWEAAGGKGWRATWRSSARSLMPPSSGATRGR